VPKKKARNTELEKLKSGIDDGKVPKVQAKKQPKEKAPKIVVESTKGGREKANNMKSINDKATKADNDGQGMKKGSNTNAKVSI
jgi:hypothetical protein